MRNTRALVLLIVLFAVIVTPINSFADINQDLISNANNVEKVKEILDKGADVNTRDQDGWTAIMEAVAQLNFDSVEVLLSRKANINARDNDGKTPLMLALEGSTKEHTMMAKFLIEHGANVNEMDNENNTVFAMTNWLTHYELLPYFGIDKFSSEHFDFYTVAGTDLTGELESVYAALSDKLLKFYEPALPKKIVYLAIPMREQGGAQAFYDSNLIIDPWYGANSHEIIHLFAPIKNSAFSEGMAQAFQKHGNIEAKEDNTNTTAGKILLLPEAKGFNLAKIIPIYLQGNGAYYSLMGSFVYYNIYVVKNEKGFAKFLKSLEYGEDYPAIKQKYKDALGKELDTVISDWEKWVEKVDEKSDIYVKW